MGEKETEADWMTGPKPLKKSDYLLGSVFKVKFGDQQLLGSLPNTT